MNIGRLLFAIAVSQALTAIAACMPPSRDGSESPRTPKVELFVLPAGYRGPLIAIYGQETGRQPQWRGDTAIYDVPTTGVVRTKLPQPDGLPPVLTAFADRPRNFLVAYGTCEEMRVVVTDTEPRVCGLGYERGGSGIPYHIVVGVITTWFEIPQHYNRTAFVYDSVLFHGRAPNAATWTEPSDRRPKPRSQ